MTSGVLSISILLQFTAAILALRMIVITKRRWAWICIASAICLMAIRRCVTLYRVLSGDVSHPPDLSAELIAFTISVLMLIGVAWIAPTFKSFQTTETQWQNLVEHSPNIVSIIDPKGTLLFQNRPFTNLHLGDKIWDGLQSEATKLIQTHIKTVFDTHQPVAFEISHIQSHTPPFWYEFYINLLTSPNNQHHAMLIIRDITNNKHLERESIRTQRLRVAGELSAGVSHNLNNILTGILGPAQLLEMKNRDETLREEINLIISASKQARDLIRQLHLSVRGDNEPPASIDLNQAIQEAITITRPRWKDQTESRGITIEIHENLNPTPPIWGTKSGIEDILINLIFNAVDAMPNGGQIHIETRLEKDQILLFFADTGIGMNKDVSQRIFEPFFTTKNNVGSGLGLATVYGTLQRWQGNIEVESIPQKGTTFKLTFKLGQQTATPAPHISNPTQPGPCHILIVEDEENVSQVLYRTLYPTHRVDIFDNGHTALENFEPQKYQVALIDLGLPYQSGDQIAFMLNQSDPLLITVLITGWHLDLTDPRLEPFDLYLQKPLLPDQVISTLTQALQLYQERQARSL